MTGIKHDQLKPQLNLIPPLSELELGSVLTYGANKYSADNWRKLDNLQSRYIAAAMRHINQYRQGEQLDCESGLHHLAHAMASLAFIVQVEKENSSDSI